MQNITPKKNPMNVPNWLIAVELIFGVALLYISSSALIKSDMHIAVGKDNQVDLKQSNAVIPELENTRLLLSANTADRQIK